MDTVIATFVQFSWFYTVNDIQVNAIRIIFFEDILSVDGLYTNLEQIDV